MLFPILSKNEEWSRCRVGTKSLYDNNISKSKKNYIIFSHKYSILTLILNCTTHSILQLIQYFMIRFVSIQKSKMYSMIIIIIII